MITLYQFQPHDDWGVSSLSPFCIKLETYFKITGIPYRSVYLTDPRKAPYGKLPYISDGKLTLADSGLIIEHCNHAYNVPDALSSIQQAHAMAYRRLIEDHLYWVLVYSRWMEPANWQVVKPIYFAAMPTVVRMIVPAILRKGMKKALYQHGIGRHDQEALYAQGAQSLQALQTALGSQPYFFNEQPSWLDATAYGFLASILYPPLHSPLQACLQQQSNLVQFCDRMRQRYFLNPQCRPVHG